MKAINSVLVRFTREGCEVSVSYTHGSETGAVASPDTKRRALSSTRMAAAGLRTSLEYLDKGEVQWGGYATDTRRSTDTVIVDRKVDAKAS